MLTDPDKLTRKHQQLVHSEKLKVKSHVQRQQGEWIINTLMVDGIDVPFRYKRQQAYKNLQGASVNLTYYRELENVGGMEFEVMKVVRIKIS